MSNDNFLGGFNFDTNPFTQALQSSVELMSQTWQNLGTSKTMPFATPPMNIDELDKRIEELKHVESWLSMNLAMLKNTIQGLELHRHSIASFKDLMQTVSDQHKDTPSLDEVLSNFSKSSASSATTEQTDSIRTEPKVEPKPDSEQAPTPDLGIDEAIESAAAGAQAATEAMQQAGQAWWGLLQNQLETLLTSQVEQQNQIQQVTEAAGVEPNPKADKLTPTRIKRASKPAAKRVSNKDANTTSNTETVSAAASPVSSSISDPSTIATPTANEATSRTRSKTANKTASKAPAKKVAARKKVPSTSTTSKTTASASKTRASTTANKTVAPKKSS